MRKLKVLIVALFALTATTFATDWSTNFSYNISFGAGNIGDYIGRPSWLGFSLDFKGQEESNLTWGFSFAWNSFYEKTGEIVYFEGDKRDGSLSGTQLRYLNVFPMMVNVGYVFGKYYSEIKPFVSAYIGTSYFSRQTDIGVYRFSNYAWGFTVAPEVGLKIPTSRTSNFVFSARWYNTFGVTDSFIADETNRNYITLNIGFDFAY
jgi:hypothetical protein